VLTSHPNAQNADQLESLIQGFTWRDEAIRGYTDCHCHLHEKEFNNDRLRQRVRFWSKVGIRRIIAVSMNPKSIEQTLRLETQSKTDDWPIAIYPAIGIHPWEAHKEFDIEKVRDALVKLDIPIVGEIGLDHRFVPKKRWAIQEKVFNQMLRLAEDHSAPVIIHSKDAEAQIIDNLAAFKVPRVVMHWYTGPLSLVKLAQARGHYFSITPAIEYSTVLKHLVQNLPLERLLLESDGPVGYRLDWGRILGTPSWVPIVARKIWQLRAEQRFEELLQATEANVAEVFGMNS
jgi:TatD DNase family protein